ncbi:MAG: lysophospholipid acyltransferase family protein [Actinomycetota bacterium]
MASLLDEVRQVARGWRWGRRPLVPRSAEPFAPLPEPREFPTEWARTPVGRAARAAIQRFALRPLVWSETDPRVHGLDHLERLRGPVVFVANHSSHLDAPLILCSLPERWRRRTAVGAAADYFFDVWWRAAGTALVFNAFPVERSGGRRLSDTPWRLLREGWSMVVFPEGTRSKDGWVGRFRPGVARLCAGAGVPAVPVAIRGSFAAMPRGRGWPQPGRFPVSVRYGPPVFPEPGEGVRAFMERLSDAMARLWDEDRDDWWGAQVRAARGRTPLPAGPSGPRWLRVWEASRPLPRRRTRPRVWS